MTHLVLDEMRSHDLKHGLWYYSEAGCRQTLCRACEDLPTQRAYQHQDSCFCHSFHVLFRGQARIGQCSVDILYGCLAVVA